MQALFTYLLKVIACSGLLLGYYWLALRNKQFHQYNRFYLLFSVIASISLPLIQMEWFVQSSNATAVKWMQIIYIGNIPAPPARTINWWLVIQVTLATISLLLLLIQAMRIRQLFRLKNRFRHTLIQQKFVLIHTDLPQAPFSFFNWLFWRNDLDMDNNTGRKIWRHELTHIQEKHTWDKLLMQLVLCFYWMNPFFWILQKELHMVHEFIADAKAIQDKDASAFAAMLLQATYAKFPFAPAQPFFYSPIKRRLTMFTTSKQPRYSYMRRLMVLPVTGIVLLLFAFRVKAQEQNSAVKKEKNVSMVLESKTITIDETNATTAFLADRIRIKQKPKEGWGSDADSTAFKFYGEVYVVKRSKEPIDTSDKSYINHIISDAEGKVTGYASHDSASVSANKVHVKTKAVSTPPLYMIDGEEVAWEAVNALAPEAIQSVDVFKGTAATAKYGSKGANGVVEIHTKAAQKQ
ncbi:TonB-dependent outer membrane receptor, SusC/RagA subfamily, signature region [Filimonas lacunae]|uniref:TonB-dependent outer membrane receptor, SusC/RagA subfamily, signature region n=1 Tax=Filimonas lacunae TaxID=477680 RepID=A0A173MDS6_9BACT|nr:M56 family metallopeptidase [Filimonas lacunae]BAV05680.1 peptidase M56 BlaR1 [Filimonas lacunae]SIT28923.1 TonB-dependent outer membrane receptor, SusC/RagA subfamily, signature region [Filimonas lacunae]